MWCREQGNSFCQRILQKNQGESGIGLLFLEGKMDRELEKRREFHMSTLFLLWLHAQWRVGFVEHRGHSQGHTVDREGPCMCYKGVWSVGKLMKANFICSWFESSFKDYDLGLLKSWWEWLLCYCYRYSFLETVS